MVKKLVFFVGLFFFLAASLFSVIASEVGGLRGKVVDEKGKGVAEAKVSVTSSDGRSIDVTTDSKGEFIYKDLPAGDYSIAVDAKGFKGSELVQKQHVSSGKTTKLGGNIVLERSQSVTVLRGAVFNERGFSLPNAKVEIENSGGEKYKKDYITNGAGEFAFRLPENGGQFNVTASAKGFESETKTVDISSGEARNLAFSLKASTRK